MLHSLMSKMCIRICQYDVEVYNVMTLLLISTGHGNNRNCGIKGGIRQCAICVPGQCISRFK